MPTFTEWEARRKGGGSAPLPTSTGDPVEYDANYQPDPNNERLSFTEDPSRYLGHAAKGILRSPIDLVKGFLGLPGQVVKGLTQDLPELVKDPSLLMEIPGAIKEGAKYANTHPEEMGSLLGQSLMAPKVPGAANTVLAEGPGVVGRGVSAVGRGMEAVGTSRALKSANKYGAIGTAMSGHPGLAALELAAPPLLEHGGKLAQRGGAALEGLDLAYKGKAPFARDAEPVPVDPADVMREKVAGARGDVEAGFSRKVASKLNGLKSSATDVSHPSADVANPGELFPYQRDAIQGLREARDAAAKGDSAWANDASAQPDPRDAGVRFSTKAEADAAQAARPQTPDEYAMDNAFTRARGGEPGPRVNDLAHTLPQSAAFRGLQDAVRRSNLSPIERFYEDDPQARTSGEGRMTGQFTEGEGGLSDVASGKVSRYPMPEEIPTDEGGRPLYNAGSGGAVGPLSPLDELSRMSGRALPGADIDALLKRFGGRGAGS